MIHSFPTASKQVCLSVVVLVTRSNVTNAPGKSNMEASGNVKVVNLFDFSFSYKTHESCLNVVWTDMDGKLFVHQRLELKHESVHHAGKGLKMSMFTPVSCFHHCQLDLEPINTVTTAESFNQGMNVFISHWRQKPDVSLFLGYNTSSDPEVVWLELNVQQVSKTKNMHDAWYCLTGIWLN